MYSWKKKGLIFNPKEFSGRPWLKEFAQAPSAVIFDDFVRVYFSCRPPADEQGQYVSYTAYVDLDRQDLTKVLTVSDQPILNLGDLGTFDEFGVYPTSVIKVGSSFFAYYGGWTRCESVPFNVAIGLATSSDGVKFTRLGPGPILSYSANEPFILSGPKIRKFDDTYFLWYIAGKKWKNGNNRPEPVYTIRMATSANGIDWHKDNRELIPIRLEEDECQASPDVIFKNGMYHMFFCYRYSINYKSKEFAYRIGYASSTDKFNWTRDDSKAGIHISEEGWDSEMISYPHIFELDGKIFMLYLGNEVGRFGFGLAELIGDL